MQILYLLIYAADTFFISQCVNPIITFAEVNFSEMIIQLAVIKHRSKEKIPSH